MTFILILIFALVFTLSSFNWHMLLTFAALVGVSALHARQEREGELWKYFGKLTGNGFVRMLGSVAGYVFIVLPAFALQSFSAFYAFRDTLTKQAFGGVNEFTSEGINLWWLGVLIGARAGDALFSHFIPRYVLKAAPNPGISTAFIYAIDSAVLLFAVGIHNVNPWGVAIGAGFFAVIQPLMRLTRNLL